MLACRRWWQRQNDLFTEPAEPKEQPTYSTGSRLRMTSCDELLPLGTLDRDQLTGTFAAWWAEYREDLRL
jgi:hypothetical protein